VSIGTYYPFIKLGLIWLGATGQCIKARKAAGDTIDLWDYPILWGRCFKFNRGQPGRSDCKAGH